MIMKKKSFINILKLTAGILLFNLAACKSDKATSMLVETDLMKHGLPIKILAPPDVEVVSSDLGFVTDVTVKGGDSFYLQIIGSDAHITNMEVLVSDMLNEVKQAPFFSEVVKEEDQGFIFKKTIDDKVNYDFRYIKIQGDKEYTFQTGLIGQFSLEDVELMFEAVK